MKLEQKKSDELFLKAQELIPGGIFGHYKFAVREEGPKFFSKAKNAYFWDIDGNKYFPVWTITNHHKFLLHDRKAIETFYFIILYNKALFQVLQGNDSVLIPEALIRYILQFY